MRVDALHFFLPTWKEKKFLSFFLSSDDIDKTISFIFSWSLISHRRSPRANLMTNYVQMEMRPSQQLDEYKSKQDESIPTELNKDFEHANQVGRTWWSEEIERKFHLFFPFSPSACIRCRTIGRKPSWRIKIDARKSQSTFSNNKSFGSIDFRRKFRTEITWKTWAWISN